MEKSITATGSELPKLSTMTLKPRQTDNFSSAQRAIRVEEIPGTAYNDLEQAQAELLPGLAMTLANIIRQAIEDGALKVIDGVVQ
jgi:hypothetical protein